MFTISKGLILCPTCRGNDPFCPQCGGNKRIRDVERITKLAILHRKGEGQLKYEPRGQFVEGEMTLVLQYIPGEEESEYIIKNATTVEVDSKSFIIDKFKRAGKPANRYYVICKEDESLDRRDRPS